MPNKDPRPPTRQKALDINLDKELYGTFSEIGAGQEIETLMAQALELLGE